jgi:hypothetical protein
MVGEKQKAFADKTTVLADKGQVSLTDVPPWGPRPAKSDVYGLTTIITMPCDATGAENLP